MVPMGVPTSLMAAQQNVRPVVEQTQVLQGSDFFGNLTVLPAPTTEQRILRTIFVSPSFFPGTRITELSNLWERYRFMSFRLRYVPAVPTTLACQLVMYFDTDPSDDPTGAASSEELVRQAIAHTGAQQWNFNMPKVTQLPQRSDDEMYYTGEVKQNVRFSLQAKAYIIQITDPLNFNGAPITDDVIAGSLFVDWKVKLQLPQINPSAFAIKNATNVETVFPASTVIDTTPLVYQLTGLDPLRRYLIAPKNPTGIAASGTFYAQIKTEQREDFAGTSTNRIAWVAGPDQDTGGSIAYARSNEKGVITFYVYANTDGLTLTAAMLMYYTPA